MTNSSCFFHDQLIGGDESLSLSAAWRSMAKQVSPGNETLICWLATTMGTDDGIIVQSCTVIYFRTRNQVAFVVSPASRSCAIVLEFLSLAVDFHLEATVERGFCIFHIK